MVDFRTATNSRLRLRQSLLMLGFGAAALLQGCSQTLVVPPRPPFPPVARWEKVPDYPLSSPLASDGTLVFAALSDGAILGIEPVSGTVIWTRGGDKPGLLASGARFLVFVEKGGLVWGLNPQDGNALWKATTKIKEVQSVRLDGNRVFIGGASGFASLIVSTGEVRFDLEAKDVRDVDAAGDFLASLEEGALVVRERDTGTVRYRLESPEQQFGAPAIFSDGRVVLGSGSRFVRAVSKEGRFGWRFKVGARVKQRPLDYLDRKRVGIISFEGVYYELSLGGGDMRHRVLLSSRPFATPILSEGRIWASIFEDEIAVIDVKTMKLIGRAKYGGSFLQAPVLVSGQLVAEVTGPRRVIGLQTAPQQAPPAPAASPTPPRVP